MTSDLYAKAATLAAGLGLNPGSITVVCASCWGRNCHRCEQPCSCDHAAGRPVTLITAPARRTRPATDPTEKGSPT